ncbi:MAG: DEAD/DEAH box helicase family protein, partial [Deltaproteobacteria bacterium]|nr:DEAD/DEAH box helicase family protein [Deltaproteobacteria bacterium]
MNKAKVRLHRGTIYLSNVPGDSDFAFKTALEKAVGSVKYHGGHRRWVISLSREAVAGLKSLGATLPPEFGAWEKEQNGLAVRRKEANELKTASGTELRTRLETAGVRFKHRLFDHQIIGAAYAIRLPAAALLMDTGTGKTAAMATVMQAFADKLGFNRMLVIAPKTILNSGWGSDLDKFSWLSWVNIGNSPRRQEITECPVCRRAFKRHVQWRHMKTHMTKAVAKFGEDGAKRKMYESYPDLFPPAQDDKRKRLLAALESDAQVFLINPESFKLVIEDLMDQDWDMCTVDESSMLKSPRAGITQKMQVFAGSVLRRYIMTATPRPNSSLDFWGQMAFLDNSLGGNFSAFREKHFYQGYDGFSWHPKDELNTDKDIWDIVSQRSYRVKLEDCVDLPGETTERMEVTLSAQLWDHYHDMLNKMEVVVKKGVDEEGKIIDTQWRIVQMNKLAQITSGYIFDNDGGVEFLGDSSKVAATLDMARRLVENEDRFV